MSRLPMLLWLRPVFPLLISPSSLFFKYHKKWWFRKIRQIGIFSFFLLYSSSYSSKPVPFFLCLTASRFAGAKSTLPDGGRVDEGRRGHVAPKGGAVVCWFGVLLICVPLPGITDNDPRSIPPPHQAFPPFKSRTINTTAISAIYSLMVFVVKSQNSQSITLLTEIILPAHRKYNIWLDCELQGIPIFFAPLFRGLFFPGASFRNIPDSKLAASA